MARKRKKTIKDIMRNSGSKLNKSSLTKKLTSIGKAPTTVKVKTSTPLIKEILKKSKKKIH